MLFRGKTSSVVLMPEVRDTCPKTVFSFFSVYFYTQSQGCALLLERKELICRLATPRERERQREKERDRGRMWSKERS